MQALRGSSMLARLVLAWFALVLGVAAASPVVHLKSMEVVCAPGVGVKVVYADMDGEPAHSGQHTLDCSLCLPASGPVPRGSLVPEIPRPLAHAVEPGVAAHIAGILGAPLPPRGPPPFA
jgi:hypothetical protein